MPVIETLENFAKGIHLLLKSDRDVNVGAAGFTGEGKTTFVYQLKKEYCKIAKVPFSFENNMTYDREELLKWIDGKPNTKPGKNGLKEGQLPEYSPILVDELFSIFYKRNWYNDDQKLAVAVFNMCRDRHLFIGGNIPNFWDLDGGFISRIRYYAYVHERGKAWIFEQENNPFAADKWNININRKIFRKSHGRPYKLPNFVCEVDFPDFTPQEKKEYYKIRNLKRTLAADQMKTQRVESYRKIKRQRDTAISMVFKLAPKTTLKTMAEMTGLSQTAVRLIKEGVR